MTIVLIGAMGVGKSTVGALLAEKLKLPQFSIDDHRFDYYAEAGYDEDKAREIHQAEGMKGIIRYWKDFEAYAVERIMQDYPDHIIDLGAGHSVYEDEAHFAKVAQALAPHPVILLQPSADEAESIKILNDRFVEMHSEELGGEIEPFIFELNAHFVQHPSNRKLAKMTVYTKDKTPQQTCDEIIKRLQSV